MQSEIFTVFLNKSILLRESLTVSNSKKTLIFPCKDPLLEGSLLFRDEGQTSFVVEGGKERGGNDRGKARRNHEILLDREDV